MAKKIKEFFNNYPGDVKFSRDIEDVKKNIRFASHAEDKKEVKKVRFSLKYILAVLVTILIVAPTTFLITSNYNQGGNIPSGGSNDEFYIARYMDETYDQYIENAIKTELYGEDLEIAFYLGMSQGKSYLVVYVRTQSEYDIRVSQGYDFKIFLSPRLKVVFGSYDITEFNEFDINLEILKTGEETDYLTIPIDLTEYIDFLKE